MAYNVPRSVVETFCAVYAARDVEKIAEFLHDDVVWTISGPVDVLSYCGTHCGKAVVKDLIARKVLSMFRVISFVQESMLADGDRVAMLNRRTAQRIADGRLISYRVANFLRFQDGKVIENLSLLDSFDAAEQMLGRSLAVNSAPASADGNVIAL